MSHYSHHTSTRLRKNETRSDESVDDENDETRTFGEIRENRIRINIPHELRVDGYEIVDGINIMHLKPFLPSGFSDEEITPDEIYDDIMFQLEKHLKYTKGIAHQIIFGVPRVNEFTFQELENVLNDKFEDNPNVEICFHETSDFQNFRFVRLEFTNIPRDNFKVFELCEELDAIEDTQHAIANYIHEMTEDRLYEWNKNPDPSIDVLRFCIPYKGTNTIQGIKMFASRHLKRKFRIMTTLDKMCRVDIFAREKVNYVKNNSGW